MRLSQDVDLLMNKQESLQPRTLTLTLTIDPNPNPGPNPNPNPEPEPEPDPDHRPYPYAGERAARDDQVYTRAALGLHR